MASVLLTRGRLSVIQLVRFTELKPRTVRAVILVLVQHNLLWHSTSEEDGAVLEFNINECLTRLRFGRYVWLAGVCFGKQVCVCYLDLTPRLRSCQAADIVELILDHGKLRSQDIIPRFAALDPVKGLNSARTDLSVH